MKFAGAAILVAGLIVGAAYIGGFFDAEVKIIINEDAKERAVEFTTETINKARDSTDKMLDKLQQRLEEETKEKK